MTSPKNLLSIQEIIGKCQIHEKLGSSPLGSIYRAVHPLWGNCVLKHLTRLETEGEKFLQHFFQPLTNMLGFSSHHLAKVYQTESEREIFILRELVPGITLGSQLTKGALSLPEATVIALGIAQALHIGSQQSLVFKNLKPNNIVITPTKRVKILDFSLPPTNARYIAPEQFQKKKSTIVSDIYSLGVIYYQMLKGDPPFEGKSTEEIIEQHLNCSPNLDFKVPREVKEILERMLAKQYHKRLNDPASLVNTLQKVLDKISSTEETRPRTTRKFREIRKAGRESSAPNLIKGEKIVRVNRTPCSSSKPLQRTKARRIPSAKREEREAPPTTMKMLGMKRGSRVKKSQKVLFSDLILRLEAEDFEKNLPKTLLRITAVEEALLEQEKLPKRRVFFPPAFEKTVIDHLLQTFHRECWLLKKSELSELEVEIDLEEGYLLRYYYYYEEALQKALAEANNDSLVKQSKAALVSSEEEQLDQTISYSPESEDTISFLEGEFANRQEEKLEEKLEETIDMNMTEEVPIVVQEQKAERGDSREVLMDKDPLQETIDIDLSNSEKLCLADQVSQKLRGSFLVPEKKVLQVEVDFSNPHQVKGWKKFLADHQFQRGEHFEISEEQTGIRIATIFIYQLQQQERAELNIRRIKAFFEADYEISELDRGGMGAILKLTSKNESTILSLRPENAWARKKFSSYLQVRKSNTNQEIVYAELPKNTSFVIKVAFEGHEESLIQEAKVLSMLAEDPVLCPHIVTPIQQGRLFAHDEEDHEQVGYYLMLEYISLGDAEQLYQSLPKKRLHPTVAIYLLYGMVVALQRLQKKGIIHRDLKPQNILFSSEGVPKLCDFGLAITTTQNLINEELTNERIRLLRVIDPEFLKISRAREMAEAKLEKLLESKGVSQADLETVKQRRLVRLLQDKEKARAEALKGRYRPISAEENASRKKFAGSLFYAAPEQFNTETVLSPACDIYQLGAVMFTMLTGRKPVDAENTADIISQILYPVKAEIRDFNKDDPLIDALSTLVEKMRAHHPEERITLEELKKEVEDFLETYHDSLATPPSYTEEQQLSRDLYQYAWQQLSSRQKRLEEEKEYKIIFACPGCGKKLHIYPSMDSKKGMCPSCRKKIIIKLKFSSQEEA